MEGRNGGAQQCPDGPRSNTVVTHLLGYPSKWVTKILQSEISYSGTQGCWYLDFENLPILVKSDDFFTISTPGSFCTGLDRSPRLKTLSSARLWCFRASVVPTTPSGGRDRARIPYDPSIWGGRPYKDLHRILELRATKKRCRIPRDPECFEKIRYPTF